MRHSICSDTGDLAVRNRADREVRGLCRRILEMTDRVRFAIREEVRDARLALVGDDDRRSALVGIEAADRLLRIG